MEVQKNRGETKYFHWVKRYWSSRGDSLDFIKHKYLVDIYNDQFWNIVIMKSAQVGMTERLLTEALWLPDQRNCNSIYFFPTTGTLGDLVQERIDQPVNNSDYLKMVFGRAKIAMSKHADKMSLKKMSKGFAYFRGSNALPAITSVAGDAIFVDELDRMTQENIPYFDKRLEHSNLKWERWASTPTYLKFGIHKKFLESDQRYYLVKCNCGEWQELTFEKNIDIEKLVLMCSKCKRAIVPWQLEGKWVAKKPKKEAHGYHINQLYSPRLDVKKLIKASGKFSESERQQFFNQNLGVPYSPKGAKLTDADLLNCVDKYLIPFSTDEIVYVGVDVGTLLHYVVRTKERIIEVGTVKNFFGVDALEEVVERYNVEGIVIDALPETRSVQEFIKVYFSISKMCYYSGLVEMKSADEYWRVSEDKINTDRTVSLDMTFAEIKKKKIKLPENYADYTDFVEHLKSSTRVITKDRKGNKRAEYIESGDDHFLHALNYAKLAVEMFGSYPVMTIM